jgi:enoyl-CoA hydratase/carnithine racemase
LSPGLPRATARLRLQHGKVNALDLELLHAITAALHEVDERAAVVITGTGTAFCAGVDLRRVVAGGPPYAREFLPALTAAFLAVFDHPGPVLAARRDEDAGVLATWSSAATMEAISGYLSELARRPR